MGSLKPLFPVFAYGVLGDVYYFAASIRKSFDCFLNAPLFLMIFIFPYHGAYFPTVVSLDILEKFSSISLEKLTV